LKKKILSSFNNNKVNVNFSVPGCLEVVSGRVSKGFGLKLISNMLKISLKKFIAFGDGMNDEDMLNITGKSCIMKNADVRLKKNYRTLKLLGVMKMMVLQFFYTKIL